MLRLIQTEFLKLRRRKILCLMLLASLIMPLFALLYFNYMGGTGVDPARFYKWSAFSYTPFIILPVVLGVLCAMLMFEENQHDMLKQLWIVPISKMGYFFSKFFVVLIYAISFMLITGVASVVLSMLCASVAFDWGSVLYLLQKCLEIGVLTAFAMLPILAIAASQKGYVLPICITLVYAFLGFSLMTINMYLHPLSSISVIIMRNEDIPGVIPTQAINVPLAFFCICGWGIASVVFANISLARRR
ncbi:MAG: ABC transporter permease [Clostridiales bacterium]|nr:ABC transporter permease [Clostridiales bacterium]